MYDVVALGEILIDFTPVKLPDGNSLFEKNPGGAPANVLVQIARLGGKAAFIGKVGDDIFGSYLKNILESNLIVTKGLKVSKEANTTLAFVELNEKGDRSFSFYRKPGADTTLCWDEVEPDLIESTRIFHFGSLSMTTEPSKEATLKAVEYAKAHGKLISYDPNWRPALWNGEADGIAAMKKGIELTNILKISDYELKLLTGSDDIPAATQQLFKDGIELIIVTLGEKGCYYKHSCSCGFMRTYDTHVVDTTGCGDTFMGALLYNIAKLQKPLKSYEKNEIENIIDFSNAAASLCCTKRGAIPAIPFEKEIEQCRDTYKKL